jgi:signal peptidase II
VPKIGGTQFEFFRPVFNVADSAIFLGLFFIFIFQKRFFPEPPEAAPTQVSLDEDEEMTATV